MIYKVWNLNLQGSFAIKKMCLVFVGHCAWSILLKHCESSSVSTYIIQGDQNVTRIIKIELHNS